MEATTTKSRECQLLLLEIFPRLACFHNGNKLPLESVVEYTLTMTSKQAQALVTFGLLSMERPQALASKASKFITIVAAQIQQCLVK